MRLWTVILALSATGCGGGCRRAPAVVADVAEFDDALLAPGGADAPPVRTQCRSVGRQGLPTLERAADAGVEALVGAPADGGVQVFWSTTGSSELGRWRAGAAGVARVEAGAGERSDPLLALDGRGALAAAWVTSRMGSREHVVWTAEGPTGRCAGPEGRDEGLSFALAGVASGWIVAWDEEGPAPAAGSIRVQLVTAGAAGTLCGAQRSVSPAAQDAADPVAVSLPGGRAAVFWLTSREVDATESVDTATDVWGVAIAPSGAPLGAPLRVTRAVDHHFGVSAFAGPDALWLALRGGGPSDSEGRGDGGEVRAVRIEFGPSGLLRAGDMAVVSDEGANPSGAPRVTRSPGPGAAAEVWWRERQGERVTVRHRALASNGRPLDAARPAAIETAMGGALPSWVDAAGRAWVLRVGDDGAELARYGCAPPAR